MSQNDTLLRNLTLLRIIPRAPLRRDTNTLHEMLKEEGFNIDIRTLQRDLQNLSAKFPLMCQKEKKWAPSLAVRFRLCKRFAGNGHCRGPGISHGRGQPHWQTAPFRFGTRPAPVRPCSAALGCTGDQRPSALEETSGQYSRGKSSITSRSRTGHLGCRLQRPT